MARAVSFAFSLRPSPDKRVIGRQVICPLLAIMALLACTLSASAQCVANPPDNTVTICMPLNTQSVPSTFTVSAAAASSTPVTKWLVYLHDVLKFQAGKTKSISASIKADGSGSQNLTVKFYNGQWRRQTIYVTVGSATVTVKPSSAILAPGSSKQFTATVTGISNTSVNWAVDGMFQGNTTVGTISTTGLYRAPGVAGKHIVTAASAASSTKTGTASVTVSAAKLSPNGVNFGSVGYGASLTKAVILTNVGATTMSISSIAITGTNPGDFAQTHTCGTTVAARASCTISITFKPVALGTRTATLSIADNAAGSPQKVPLSGTGVAGACIPYGRPCDPNAPPNCCVGSCVFGGGSTRVGYTCR